MKYASVLYRDYAENSLFTPGAGENNGEFYLPYTKLRERFLAAGIELNIPNVKAFQSGRPADGPQKDVFQV
jgi:hypothetical protein